jgi:protein-disulfide isomerase
MTIPEKPPSCVLSLPVSDRDRIQGSPDAAVTLVFYGDYQCPASAHAHRILQTLPTKDSLCIVFRHFPQPHLYPHAQRAAEAAESAGEQGRFWQMHQILFEHQDTLDNGNLLEYAIDLGLNGMRFLQDLTKHIHAAKIKADYQSGIESGIKQTPTWFINGKCYEGTWGVESLNLAIVAAGLKR